MDLEQTDPKSLCSTCKHEIRGTTAVLSISGFRGPASLHSPRLLADVWSSHDAFEPHAALAASGPQFALAPIFFSEPAMFSHFLKHSIPPTSIHSPRLHPTGLGLFSEPAAPPQPSMTLSDAAAAGVNCPSTQKGCRQ